MRTLLGKWLFMALFFASPLVNAQPMTLAEVQATGTKSLTAAEVKELVTGAKTEFTLVNGSTRIWTNESDGTLLASRSSSSRKGTARGTWSVNGDAAYCLTFDWGLMDTEAWCRQLYRVENRHYAYAADAKPETKSGSYRFSR